MAESVKAMFAEVAHGYDRANTALSWGLHHAWRRKGVRLSQPPMGGSVLDVATGTGDFAFEFRRAVGPKGRVVGLDFCTPMLAKGREKSQRTGLDVEFIEGDALDLPWDEPVFDVASIGFGVRNVDNPRTCIDEMARVVRPGGRVLVLEFGQPEGVMSWPYRAYSATVLPVVGGLLTGHPSAYSYLRRTSERFPAGERFLAMMEDTRRFVDLKIAPLAGGIAYLYLGVVGTPTGRRRSR